MSQVDRTLLIFTSGQVAHLLSVSPRTVCKWIDDGLLKGYRHPRSDRPRVPRIYLKQFLAERGIPVPGVWEPELEAPKDGE